MTQLSPEVAPAEVTTATVVGKEKMGWLDLATGLAVVIAIAVTFCGAAYISLKIADSVDQLAVRVESLDKRMQEAEANNFGFKDVEFTLQVVPKSSRYASAK